MHQTDQKVKIIFYYFLTLLRLGFLGLRASHFLAKKLPEIPKIAEIRGNREKRIFSDFSCSMYFP